MQALKKINIDAISKRILLSRALESRIYDRYNFEAIVIGNQNEIDKANQSDKNIIINFDILADLKKYPTNKPANYSFDFTPMDIYGKP